MTPDAIGSLVRQMATLLLGSVASYLAISGDQTAALASGAGAAASVIWSIYAHYGQKKVPDSAVVVSVPK